jgi:hypothetical protein
MQDTEDRCLLLMSSMSFVYLPFQEYRMTEKHHMDQNPYISSLCPKPRAVDEVSEALSMHVAPPAIRIVVVSAGVTVLLGLYNPPCS